jgi:hypothetical protein
VDRISDNVCYARQSIEDFLNTKYLQTENAICMTCTREASMMKPSSKREPPTTFATPDPGDGMTEVLNAGGGPYPYGSPAVAVGYDDKLVTFRVVATSVGSVVEVTEGNDIGFVGSIMVSTAGFEYDGSAPNSLFGIAVPTPVLVQGVGRGRREVTGLACGMSEYMFPVWPLGRAISPETRFTMAPEDEL